jgi:hypothetical protein
LHASEGGTAISMHTREDLLHHTGS